jgi:zinc transport system substrate-binding protein
MRLTARFCVLGLLILAYGPVGGCRDGRDAAGAPDVIVTNSYLECAVRDLWGPGVRVMCLAAPGMCPGHFDISPGQVKAMRDCRMLLLFDFQKQVESFLSRLKENGLKVHLVGAPEGLCVPDTYAAVCREVCGCLSEEYPERSAGFASRLTEVERRLLDLGVEQRQRIRESNLAEAEIVVSNHQSKFAQWLGLTPVATFAGSDIETVANIDDCLQKASGRDIRFVIANRQEGTSLAQALSDRLKSKVVVFSNFPLETAAGAGFDGLIRANVQALIGAAGQ